MSDIDQLIKHLDAALASMKEAETAVLNLKAENAQLRAALAAMEPPRPIVCQLCERQLSDA